MDHETKPKNRDVDIDPTGIKYILQVYNLCVGNGIAMCPGPNSHYPTSCWTNTSSHLDHT